MELRTERLIMRPVRVEDVDDLVAMHADPLTRRVFGETEVGWVLMSEARGRGVATEAGRACAEWGFRDLALPYVTAMIAPDNDASTAVARRLGMTPLREDDLHGVTIVVHALRRQA